MLSDIHKAPLAKAHQKWDRSTGKDKPGWHAATGQAGRAVPKHCRAGGRGSFSQQPGQGNKAHLRLSTTPSHQAQWQETRAETGLPTTWVQGPSRGCGQGLSYQGPEVGQWGLSFTGAPRPMGGRHGWRSQLRMVRAIKAYWCPQSLATTFTYRKWAVLLTPSVCGCFCYSDYSCLGPWATGQTHKGIYVPNTHFGARYKRSLDASASFWISPKQLKISESERKFF